MTNILTLNGNSSNRNIYNPHFTEYPFQVIVAEASTAEKRSSTVSLTINVFNKNDYAPTFPATTSVIKVGEGDYSLNPQTILTVSYRKYGMKQEC